MSMIGDIRGTFDINTPQDVVMFHAYSMFNQIAQGRHGIVWESYNSDGFIFINWKYDDGKRHYIVIGKSFQSINCMYVPFVNEDDVVNHMYKIFNKYIAPIIGRSYTEYGSNGIHRLPFVWWI